MTEIITLRCLDLQVTVTAPRELGLLFGAAYAACISEPDNDRPALRISLIEDGERAWLAVDDEEPMPCRDQDDALVRASVRIDQASVAATAASRMIFHASSARRDANAVLIAGPSGAGKSTLAAALTLSDFVYVGDEAIAMGADVTHIHANPKPFKLDRRSRSQLAAAFGPAPSFATERAGEILIEPRALGHVSSPDSPVPLQMVVHACVDTTVSADVAELSRADVAELLADQCFNFVKWGPRGLAQVANVARHCPGIRLRFSDLEAATGAIHELLK